MSSDQSSEFDEVRGALGSIGASAAIVFVGKVLSQLFGFSSRIVMTRFLPVDGYGDIVLGITVLNIFSIVSILGLTKAFVRYLPRAETESERAEIATAIYQIGLVLSVFWGAVSFFTADLIAGRIFEAPDLAGVVRVFSLTLPFYVFYKLALFSLQGQQETVPNVLTSNIVHPLTRLAALVALALAGVGTIGLSVGYNLAYVVGGIVGFAFFLRAEGCRLGAFFRLSDRSQYRDILSFSVPLAIMASFNLVTKNGDRFLLGVFDTSRAVGLYDVVFILAQFVFFFGPVLNYLFQPMVAEENAEGGSQRLEKLYTVVTRWLVVLTFPIFTLLVLFPETMLATFFGRRYVAGGTALTVLAVGNYAGRLVGISGSFLSARGKTRVLMYISIATAGLNLLLNVVLIPRIGILGAAVATALALTLNNTLELAAIYRFTGIHPFTRELLVPTTLAVCSVGLTGMVVPGSASILVAVAVSAALSLLFVGWVLLTRSVYTVELQLADSVLRQAGLELDLSERLAHLTTDK